VAVCLFAVLALAGIAWAWARWSHAPAAPLASAEPASAEAPEELTAADSPEVLPQPAVDDTEAGATREMRPGLLPLGQPRLGPDDPPKKEQPQPAPAPAPKAPPARRARTEAELLKEIARIPEVGLLQSELAPLVEGWASAYTATFDEMTGAPSFEPVPILKQRPDFAQLPLRHGRASRLTPKEADRLQKLSRRLHTLLTNRSTENCGGCHTAELAMDFKRIGGHVKEKPMDLAPIRKALRQEKEGQKPAWRRPEAIATLQQVLTPEPTPVRGLYVELLDDIEGKKSSVALAQRAVFDLAPEVRRQAIESLRKRPREEYRQVLLASLRYPWAPAAEHASEALVSLGDKEAVPFLVGMLNEPDPAAPVKLPNGRTVVREVVRMRHAFNCLACHPPAATNREPVPGAVPGINLTRVLTGSEPTAQVVNQARTQPRWVPVRTVLPPAQPTPQQLQQQQQQQIQQLVQQQQQQGGGGSHVPCTAGGGSASASSPPTVTVVAGGGGANTTPPPRILTTLVRGRDDVQSRPGLVVGRRPLPTVVLKQPLWVRGDITFLRQDFSVQLPMAGRGAGAPAMVRFDYVVRNRPVTGTEAKKLQDLFMGRASYPQREAVLDALRGLTGKDAGDSTGSWQQLFPEAEVDAKVWRLTEELVDAPDSRKEAVLMRFQTAKGVVYSEALAAAVPRLSAYWRDRARSALAARMTRMTANTLRDKLKQDDAETRRAAVLAVLRKKDGSLAPELVSLLEDGDPAVAREARLSLEGLTGKKFDSPAAWREWSGSGSAEAAGGKDTSGGE
jgi:HEAT repeat protein